MISRTLRRTITGTLIFAWVAVTPALAANIVHTIPFFTGADAGVVDGEEGVFTDANGAAWQNVRGNAANGFGGMLLNTWSDARNRWESPNGPTAGNAYEAGPILYSQGDQDDATIVFSAPIGGEYSFSGTLVLAGTDLNSLNEAKIRADVHLQECGLSTDGVLLAAFRHDAFLFEPDPQNAAWDMGAEPALSNITLRANDRLVLRCRKVGSAGELRGDPGGVTITGPATDVPATSNVVASAASMTLASEAGTVYTIQSATDLVPDVWTDTLIVSSTGTNLTVVVDAEPNANNSYRYTTEPIARPVPWFSGPDLGVGDGVEPDPGYVDIGGDTWRHHRNSPWGNYFAMRTQQWSTARARWESTSLAGSSEAFQDGPLGNGHQPTLWTFGDQADATMIYTPNVPIGGGAYSFEGTLVLDAEGTAGGIRAQVMHYDAAGNPSTLYSFTSGSDLSDQALDLGAEAGLQNIPMSPGERLGFGFRKVGAAGTVEGILYGADPVTIIGPPSPPVPFDVVNAGDADGFSFASQAGAEYSLQATTNLVTVGWCPTPAIAMGTGSDLVVFDPDYSTQVTYRVIGKLP